MKVHSIETFGTHEGPGIRLVVFLQGCNFKCAYCHNPDTIAFDGGREMKEQEIMRLLEEQRPYFADGGGLTVSGGEPSLQAEELISLFKKAKDSGFHVVLDTNGSIFSQNSKKLLDLADLALIDLKHLDPKAHLSLTGAENESVLKMIEYREKTRKPFWIRHVLVPGVTDGREDLIEMSKYLSQFKYLEYLEILPYHNLGVHKYKALKMAYRLEGVRPASIQDLRIAVDIIKKYFPEKAIRF